jgi:hypothetical protein
MAPFWREIQLVQTKNKDKRKGAQMKACDLENQDARALGSKTKKWQIEAKLT